MLQSMSWPMTSLKHRHSPNAFHHDWHRRCYFKNYAHHTLHT